MIIFVADAFIDQYVGGAELTTHALISSSLNPVGRIKSSDVTPEMMEDMKHCFWIFGNFASLDDRCMLYAIKNLKYSVLEYDYKYCKYRSPGKHAAATGECDCHTHAPGRLRALFLAHAAINWWMSDKQKSKQQQVFPFLKGETLSSVFSRDTLDYIESLNIENKNNKWIILNSKSWIKGVSESIKYAEDNSLEYELVWGLEHKELLFKLANSKGLIFFPLAGDTCPRMVIEAKLLGCELILNDNVQHKDESWFETRESSLKYLRERTNTFWNKIEEEITFLPSKNNETGPKYHIITPFYNAEEFLPKCIDSIKRQQYENFKCILVDDMSTDGSYELAQKIIADDDRFILIKNFKKCYALSNIVRSIKLSKAAKNDVIILLDGDDWFSSSLSLTHLNHYYSSDDCWMTYGSYIMHPHGIMGPEPSEYPKEIVENNLYRQDQWRASHLRTFRKHLWDHVDESDLKDSDENYYEMTYDQAIMLPLLEMSGPRSKYIPEIMHVYNKENPLNVDKIRTQEQVRTAQEIRSKKPYERL
jgi:hypothetical protein